MSGSRRCFQCLAFAFASLLVSRAHVFAGSFSYENEYDTSRNRESTIVTTRDLRTDFALARINHQPLLIEFSMAWCSYCASLEENVLEPLLLSRELGQHLVLRKLEVTGYTQARDIDGQQMRSDALARKYRVNLYPTLLLFDGDGSEVMRITGITTLDYVSHEIEAAIRAQLAAISE